MPRSAVSVLAALAFTGIIAFTAVATFNGIAEMRGGSPSTAPSGSEDEYRRLAERLLSPQFPNPDGSMSTMTLYPAAMPPSQPDPIPVPTGATVIGSTVRTRGNVSSLGVVLDVPGEPAAVTDFYKQELTAKGFAARDFGRPSGGGFVSAGGPSDTSVYCKGTTGPSFNITVWTRSGSPNDVRVNYEPAEDAGSGYGRCSQPSGGPPDRGMDRLPSLRPPDGVLMRQSGGSSGGNSQESEATATTSRSPRELEAHFAQQLAAAGWTKTGGGADTTLAWSTWNVPGDGSWKGALVIFEGAGTDRRDMLLRASGSGF